MWFVSKKTINTYLKTENSLQTTQIFILNLFICVFITYQKLEYTFSIYKLMMNTLKKVWYSVITLNSIQDANFVTSTADAGILRIYTLVEWVKEMIEDKTMKSRFV